MSPVMMLAMTTRPPLTLASWERWMQQYRDAAQQLIEATTPEQRRAAKRDISEAAWQLLGEEPPPPGS